jgi:hypothetical protein
VAAPLGIVGGLLVYLATVACASSWLSLVEQVVHTGRVRLADLPAGFGAYVGDLLAVGFLVWGLRFVASLVLAPAPFLYIVFMLATVVFLNAVPELIYLGRHAPAELLVESYRFIAENWVEWFPANLVLAACVLGVLELPGGPYGLLGEAALGVVLYFAMLVRGLLFQELASSGWRAALRGTAPRPSPPCSRCPRRSPPAGRSGPGRRRKRRRRARWWPSSGAGSRRSRARPFRAARRRAWCSARARWR